MVVQWSTWKNAESPSSLYDEQAVFVNAVSAALAGKPRSRPVARELVGLRAVGEVSGGRHNA